MEAAVETCLLPDGPEAITQAASLIRDGQVVGMPTETVYGLAANAFDRAAVERIFEAKGRPQDNPLIVHIARMQQLRDVTVNCPGAVEKLAEAFWPGPLTLVLRRGKKVPPEVSAGLGTVGVRMPAHPAALELIAACGTPLAAPSANLSGSPSPTTAAHVLADMDGRIPLIIDGGDCPVGVESTVLSLVGPPAVLRPGFVTQEELETVLGVPVALAPGLDAECGDGTVPASPGMKYRHYAPKAQLTLIEGDYPAFLAFLKKQANGEEAVAALCQREEAAHMPVRAVPFGRVGDAPSQAAELFSALRALDEAGVEKAYARMPEEGGVFAAVRNRLLRAAGFRVLRP